MPDGPKNPDKRDLGWSKVRYETVIDVTPSGHVNSVRSEPVPDERQDQEYLGGHNFFGPKVQVIDIKDGQVTNVGVERVFEGEETEEEKLKRNVEYSARKALEDADVLRALKLLSAAEWKGADLVEVLASHEGSDDTYINGYALTFPVKWTEHKKTKRFFRTKTETSPFDSQVSLSVTYIPGTDFTPKYEIENYHSPALLFISLGMDKRIAEGFDSETLFHAGRLSIRLESGGKTRIPQPTEDIKYVFKKALLKNVVEPLSELGITPANFKILSEERMQQMPKE